MLTLLTDSPDPLTMAGGWPTSINSAGFMKRDEIMCNLDGDLYGQDDCYESFGFPDDVEITLPAPTPTFDDYSHQKPARIATPGERHLSSWLPVETGVERR